MTQLKELFDGLGGGRSLAIVSVIFSITYGLSSHYIASVESRLDKFDARIIVNEMFRERTIALDLAGQRHDADQRSALERRIQQLEVLAREYERERRK